MTWTFTLAAAASLLALGWFIRTARAAAHPARAAGGGVASTGGV